MIIRSFRRSESFVCFSKTPVCATRLSAVLTSAYGALKSIMHRENLAQYVYVREIIIKYKGRKAGRGIEGEKVTGPETFGAYRYQKS